jgi:hypothetical protein
VFNPQLFISENSNDAAVENRVLGQAGSYGKQLGIIIDVLGVLIARTLDRSQLTPGETLALSDNRGLAEPSALGPAAYGPLFKHLRQFVDEQAGGPARKADSSGVSDGGVTAKPAER